MADLKGATRMTIDYSDGSQTVVNYNPISGEQTEKVELSANESSMEEEVKIEAPVEEAVVEETTEEAVADASVEETVVEPEAA